MSGLDDLVAAAMQRKLIPSPTRLPLHLNEEEEPPPLQEPAAPLPIDVQPEAESVQPKKSVPAPVESIVKDRAPDVSLAFAVNGVKCIVTVHVEAGATVTTPSTTQRKAPSGGVKVKGVRGAKTEEVEAPEASSEVFDTAQPIGDDNLPEGWVVDPVVGAMPAPPAWKCPDHGKAEERTSTITGRAYTVCPDCGKLAPR